MDINPEREHRFCRYPKGRDRHQTVVCGPKDLSYPRRDGERSLVGRRSYDWLIRECEKGRRSPDNVADIAIARMDRVLSR